MLMNFHSLLCSFLLISNQCESKALGFLHCICFSSTSLHLHLRSATHFLNSSSSAPLFPCHSISFHLTILASPPILHFYSFLSSFPYFPSFNSSFHSNCRPTFLCLIKMQISLSVKQMTWFWDNIYFTFICMCFSQIAFNIHPLVVFHPQS